MNLDKLTQQISAFTDKEHGKGATQEHVAFAERNLGVVLPESYRFFLQMYGWARFSHQEMYGLGHDVPSHLDLVKNTLVERTQMCPNMPSFLVPIMNDGAGNHHCLDTRQFTNGECPIVFWDHELGSHQEIQKTADTFIEWLTLQLAELK